MAMRFTLLSTLGATGGERKVRVPGLGRWHKSKPDVAGFSFKQEFLNLTGGGSYRVRIEFRWYDEAGAVVKSAKRRSPSCRQLDRLPNLRVQVVSGQPTQPKGVWRYGLRVGNDGLARAATIGVRLSIDGAVAGQTTAARARLGRLDARERARPGVRALGRRRGRSRRPRSWSRTSSITASSSPAPTCPRADLRRRPRLAITMGEVSATARGHPRGQSETRRSAARRSSRA